MAGGTTFVLHELERNGPALELSRRSFFSATAASAGALATVFQLLPDPPQQMEAQCVGAEITDDTVLER